MLFKEMDSAVNDDYKHLSAQKMELVNRDPILVDVFHVYLKDRRSGEP